MKLQIFEKGFNYSQDGPGNRLVYHLQGCNMGCPWCSNPEGMMPSSSATSISVEQLADEIISCVAMFFDGGGVTFSGGECSLQSAGLLKVIELLHEQNISVAIESNAATSEFLQLALTCNYVIVDYKQSDAERLSHITGGALSRIEQNIRALLLEKAVHIRIPVIHGFNDDDESLKGFIAFFTSLLEKPNRFDVELLPYHEYGKDKWMRCGREYTVIDGFVTSKRLKQMEDSLREAGVTLVHT